MFGYLIFEYLISDKSIVNTIQVCITHPRLHNKSQAIRASLEVPGPLPQLAEPQTQKAPPFTLNPPTQISLAGCVIPTDTSATGQHLIAQRAGLAPVSFQDATTSKSPTSRFQVEVAKFKCVNLISSPGLKSPQQPIPDASRNHSESEHFIYVSHSTSRYDPAPVTLTVYFCLLRFA